MEPVFLLSTCEIFQNQKDINTDLLCTISQHTVNLCYHIDELARKQFKALEKVEQGLSVAGSLATCLLVLEIKIIKVMDSSPLWQT